MRYNSGFIGVDKTPTATNQQGIHTASNQFLLRKLGYWSDPPAGVSATDPYFNYTTLLLSGDGTNGGQNNTFQDSSTNNFTITRNGNTSQGTFSPFSQTGWSNYFGSGGASYLIANATDTSKFAFGTGDFTIEFWMYAEALTAPSGLVTFYDQRAASTDGVCPTIYYYSDQLLVYVQATNVIYGSSLSLNQWTHIALSRVSGNSRLFVNGVQTGSTYSDSNNYVAPSSDIRIFANCYGGSRSPTGYCSNFRVVKGTGLYSANFTPSTSPLTAITNTQLLTCQSNRFVDNSSNALTVTPYNTPSVQAFSPFAPTAAYSASTVGGSGYFDGTGDNLVTSTNAALAMSSGDFTVEAWVNVSSTTGYRYIFDFRDGSGAATTIYAYLNVGTMNLYVGVGTTNDSASGSITLGAWAHVALVRSGSTITVYINGVSTNSFSSSQNFSTSTAVTIGSRYTIEQYFIGYISNLRVVKGTAVYTTAFTPPTALLTNISNTSLLLNFTNAAIIDNTAKNDLETVGNAQISTTQSKFGGSSMYFDGTGDLLVGRNSNLLQLASGPFTIEFWYRTNTLSPPNFGYACIVGMQQVSGAGGWGVWQLNQTISFFIDGGASSYVTGNLLTSTSVWYHVAVTRDSSNNMKTFIDGVQQGSQASVSFSNNATQPLTVGGINTSTGWNENYYVNGYIDDLRITKGIARYTANFTSPSAALQLL